MNIPRVVTKTQYNQINVKRPEKFSLGLAIVRTPVCTFSYFTNLRFCSMDEKIETGIHQVEWQNQYLNLSLPYSTVHYFSLDQICLCIWNMWDRSESKHWGTYGNKGLWSQLRFRIRTEFQDQDKEEERREWMPSLRAHSSTTILPSDEV